MYDDAHVNVLEETLPFQANHRSKRIEGKKIQNVEVTIMWIQLGWLRLFLESMFFVKVKNM
jgi:hypothetical protein